MEFTPSDKGNQPDAPAERPAVAYKPTRLSPSMAGSSAPIPGVGQPVQFRGVPPAPEVAGQPAPAEAQPDGQGAPGEEEPLEDVAARADLTKRMALLTEKDKRIRERGRLIAEAEKELKALRQELDAKNQELEAREAKLREWEAKDGERRRDPQKVLRDYGFVPEAALQYMLSGGKLTPEQEAALKLDEQLAAERQKTQDALAADREKIEAQLKALKDDQARLDEERQRQAEEDELAAKAEQERQAVEELHADIGDIIAGDAQSFPLLSMAKGGTAAVFQKVQELSDDALSRTGRRPPITTKLLEQAAKSVEAAARKELEEANAKLGIGGGAAPAAPRRPQTLTNSGVQRPQGGAPAPQREETPLEKRNRMIAVLDEIKRRQQGQ